MISSPSSRSNNICDSNGLVTAAVIQLAIVVVVLAPTITVEEGRQGEEEDEEDEKGEYWSASSTIPTTALVHSTVYSTLRALCELWRRTAAPSTLMHCQKLRYLKG